MFEAQFLTHLIKYFLRFSFSVIRLLGVLICTDVSRQLKLVRFFYWRVYCVLLQLNSGSEDVLNMGFLSGWQWIDQCR